MTPPRSTVCVVHGGVDDRTAINRIAKETVLGALDAGWEVTVVAKDLEPALADHVNWRHLARPQRLHVAQWISARNAVEHALGTNEYDAVVGWQAQLVGLLDVYHCEFLSEPARALGGFAPLTSPRSALLRAQQEVVTVLEARCFRRWAQDALMIYSSNLIKEEFERCYPTPRHQVMIENFGPPPAPATAEERDAARVSFGIFDPRGPVLGFLGGFDQRKGVRELLGELRAWPEARLVLAGPDFGARPARLPPNVVAVGHLTDVRPVLAASDVLVVPSRFDPFASVVLEAAAVGTPAILTPEVGARDAVLRFDAGLIWDRNEPLRNIATRIANRLEPYRLGALDMARALQSNVFRAAIVEQLRVTIERKRVEEA